MKNKIYIICHTWRDVNMTIKTEYSPESAVETISELIGDVYKKEGPNKDPEEYVQEYYDWVNKENDGMCENVIALKVLNGDVDYMIKRSELFETEHFSTNFTFQDLYNNMEDHQTKKIDLMSNDDLHFWILKNQRCIEKGFDSGIMTDWTVVTRSIMSNLEI